MLTFNLLITLTFLGLDWEIRIAVIKLLLFIVVLVSLEGLLCSGSMRQTSATCAEFLGNVYIVSCHDIPLVFLYLVLSSSV